MFYALFLKKYLSTSKFSKNLPEYSSRSLTVLPFTFRSRMHLEMMFLYDVMLFIFVLLKKIVFLCIVIWCFLKCIFKSFNYS